MNILSWNVRGLGGGRKSRVIKKLVAERKISFMGLMETKCSSIKESMVSRLWSSDEYKWATINATDTRGHLLCIWGEDFMSLETIVRGDKWLCIKGFKQELSGSIAIILVYDPYTTVEKRALWDELLNVKNNQDVPLIVMGGFNEIKCPEERLGCLNATGSMGEFWGGSMT